MGIDFKTIFKFLFLIVITVITTYFIPKIISTAWLIGILILYWYSDDEPFWLAFFLVVSDGFIGFFGLYEVTIKIFPGMPSIEIGQFYVLLSVLKARYKKQFYSLFFKNILNIMGIYLLILLLLSVSIGVKGELNAYFRIIKLVFPFLLFYSIPKLITNHNDFSRFFALIFPISLLATGAQIYEIINIRPLSSFLGAKEFVEEKINEGEPLRSFYNPGIITLTFFGSLYFSTIKNSKFNLIYLNVLTVFAFSMAFFSATRGWILGFGLVLILYIVFIGKLKSNRIFPLIILGVLLLIVVRTVPIISTQFYNSYSRFTTIEDVAEGDVSAGGTNIRLTERSPRVMNKWKESPIVGFGFSNDFREYYDSHTGNQTILLNSGIIGSMLLLIFFIYFVFKLFRFSNKESYKALKVFPVFFIGWYLIHSTSGLIFGYFALPGVAIPEVVFFSFASLNYHEYINNENF